MKRKYILPTLYVKVIEVNHILANSPGEEVSNAATDNKNTYGSGLNGNGGNSSAAGDPDSDAKMGFFEYVYDDM